VPQVGAQRRPGTRQQDDRREACKAQSGHVMPPSP
jgi:hypothetical protein